MCAKCTNLTVHLWADCTIAQGTGHIFNVQLITIFCAVAKSKCAVEKGSRH